MQKAPPLTGFACQEPRSGSPPSRSRSGLSVYLAFGENAPAVSAGKESRYFARQVRSSNEYGWSVNRVTNYYLPVLTRWAIENLLSK